MNVEFGAFEVLPAILTLLVALAFQVGIVVLGVVVAWRWLHRPGGFATTPPARPRTALELLDERYARGDIEARDYEERRTRLRG